MEDRVIMFDGMTAHDMACRLADAVAQVGPYVEIIIEDERVVVRKQNIRICLDD